MSDLNAVRREAAGLLAELRQEGATVTCPCCPKTRPIEAYRPFVAGENPLWLPEALDESETARKKLTGNLSKSAGGARERPAPRPGLESHDLADLRGCQQHPDHPV